MQRRNQTGFSLLEVLLVMAIIASAAAFIIPQLTISDRSAVMAAFREFTGTIRGTYDNALLTGQLHRIVISPKTGEYWTEIAPAGFCPL